MFSSYVFVGLDTVARWQSKTLKQGRDLFPTSNCLKAAQRERMLYRELLATQADILCLQVLSFLPHRPLLEHLFQEVDRLDKLLPVLANAGYAHHYAAGAGKKHGCLIAFKENMYTVAATKMIEYDNEHVRLDGEEQARRGRSFNTRNIGSLVSLQSKSKENMGVIVATTHLFWHPRCVRVFRGPVSYLHML